MLYNAVYTETALLYAACRGQCAGVEHRPGIIRPGVCLSGEN